MFHKVNKEILNNVLRSDYSRRALLSYIRGPFVGVGTFHTNAQESRILAKVIGELGYNVDVVNFTFDGRIDYANYDLIFGFGEPLEGSFEIPRKLKRICYMTGANVCFQNSAEIRRIRAVTAARGCHLSAKRVVPWTWSRSTMMADALVILGNEWTTSTYETFTEIPIYRINATALFSDRSSRSIRDFSQAKHSFLWFGGTGLVHKGLDLCLDVFTRHPNYTLHICGPREEDFFAAFRDELEKPNIVFHGLVDAESETFANIASVCAFALLPTCSEGQSTALLTAMAAGLIPITTRYSGIDVDVLGFVLEQLSDNELETQIGKAMTTDTAALQSMSERARDHVLENHSIRMFEAAIRSVLRKCLES